MSTIVTRAGKGSALTHAEVDANFTNLNTDKVEGQSSSVDSEIALFSGTDGKTIKRATTTGVLKATSGVISAAVAGTDYADVSTANTFTNNQVISVNSATDALRITQTGAGNALVVEDSTNPDSTPFVITGDGNLVYGATSAFASGSFIQAIASDSSPSTNIRLRRISDSLSGTSIAFDKARGASTSSPTIVQSADQLGSFTFNGYDGSSYLIAAQIRADVDGTPGTNDMPGRLGFFTTADGASSPTERMRIDSAGNVGIGTATVPYKLVINNATTYSSAGLPAATSAPLHITCESSCNVFLDSFNGAATGLNGRAAGGTSTAPSATTSGTALLNIGGRGYGTTGYSTLSRALIGLNAEETWTDTAQGTNITFATTAIGTAARVERMRIAADGTTSIGAAPGSESLRVTPVASAVNRIEAFGAVTGSNPYIFANGSDTNVGLTIYSKGTGSIFLDTSVSTATAFGVELGASTTVNRDTYIDFHSSSGTDYDFRFIRNNGVNNSANFINAGSGGIAFQTNSGTSQFNIIHTASAVNYLQATGSATNAPPILSAQGSDTNIGITLTPKGTGGVGIGVAAPTALVNIAAGTATANTAPLKFTSGTNLTTPEAGVVEYDGTTFYVTPVASNRAVNVAEHFVARTGTKTMTSNTNLQAIFSGGSGGLTNGALTVAASTSYYFECSINVSSMSATSGNFGFSIVGGGTATFTSAAWHSVGLDATTQTTAAANGGIWSSNNAETGNIVTAAVGTACSVIIKGIFRINAGGTIIPSIQLTTSASAVIGVNTWFKCYPIGSNTVISVGNWS